MSISLDVLISLLEVTWRYEEGHGSWASTRFRHVCLDPWQIGRVAKRMKQDYDTIWECVMLHELGHIVAPPCGANTNLEVSAWRGIAQVARQHGFELPKIFWDVARYQLVMGAKMEPSEVRQLRFE